MIRIIRRSISQRTVKLTFEGLKPKRPDKIPYFLHLVARFFNAFASYIAKRTRGVFYLFGNSVYLSNKYSREAKRYLVRKLIWSRGRLGRPIANFIVMVVALIVFMFGEVFNSSKFVVSQEINPDYLSTVSDIIPPSNMATTVVPESRKRNQPFTYTVAAGDTLSSIGNRYKISVAALEYVNGLSDNTILKVGQELTIPPVSGLIHTVEKGDSLASIAKKYSVAEQAIADFNYIIDTSSLALGTELVIPDAKVPQPVIVPTIPAQFTAPSFTPPSGSFGCVWPTTTRIITQYFSWYHNGVDIAVPWGQGMPPIYSCTGGVVTRSGWDPWGLGLHVEVDHGNGYSTVYGHMSRVDVGYGQEVGRGSVLGLMGNTGRSTGPHVHYIVKYNGVAQNPLNYTN